MENADDPFNAESAIPVPETHIVAVHPDDTIVYYDRARAILPCLPPPHAVLTRHQLRQPDAHVSHMDEFRRLNAAIRGKPILIIANPRAGRGSVTAHRSCMRVLSDILTDAGLRPVVNTTERPGHAVALVAAAAARFRDYAAVVSVGGDGTLHEVVAGLMAQLRDAPHGIEIPPLAVVPSGTGNAVAVSLRLPSVAHAALNILHALRHHQCRRPVAVLRYRARGPAGVERVAIGGVQWGFPAEVDLGTEWMRGLGDLRFQLGSVHHIAKRNDYYARFVIRVHPERHQRCQQRLSELRTGKSGASVIDSEQVTQLGDDEFVFDGRFLMVVAWNCKSIADGFELTPLAEMTEVDAFDVLVVPSVGLNRGDMLNFLNHADGSFLSLSDNYAYFKATSISFECLEGNYLTLDGESIPVEPFILDLAPETGSISLLDSFSSTT